MRLTLEEIERYQALWRLAHYDSTPSENLSALLNRCSSSTFAKEDSPLAQFWLRRDLEGVDPNELQKKLKGLPYREFLKPSYWPTIRHIDFVRDRWLCRYCGMDWCGLEVHHTTYKNHGSEHLYLDDLKTACSSCHAKISVLAGLGINYDTECPPNA